MMLVTGRRLAPVLAFAWLAACAVDRPTADERVGTAADEVINGQADAGHPMVVAYLRSGSLCSATIVSVKGSTGYALTAAHCVGSDLGELVIGSEVGKPVKKFAVTDRLAHPAYAKSTLYDLAMLKFSGADASTPTMPVLTAANDALKAGSAVVVVGFGKTQDAGNQSGAKYQKAMTVGQATDLRLVYDQKAGGICSGDSGGPTLAVVGGVEHVAGVHSYISSNNGSCLVEGTDIRVSPFLETFVNAFIDGKPVGALNCDQCSEAHTWQGQCTNTVLDCYKDKQCSSYQACAAKCKTASCLLGCEKTYPTGYALYSAILDCVCDTGCPTECGAEPFCNPPACGLTGKLQSCQACFETSCCAEAKACGESGTCLDCVSSLVPGPACKDDPVTAAYDACLAANCAAPCGIKEPPTTSATTATSGAGGGDATSGTGGSGGSPATTATGAGGAKSDDELTTEVTVCSARGGRARPGASVGLAAALGLGLALRRRRRHP